MHNRSFIFLNHSYSAQLNQTINEVIADYGTNYKSQIAESGAKVLVYGERMKSKASGNYIKYKAIYFTILENGNEICLYYRVIEPKSEINSTVNYFKNNYVQIDEMLWKDYENNIMYLVDVTDEFSSVGVWRDNGTK